MSEPVFWRDLREAIRSLQPPPDRKPVAPFRHGTWQLSDDGSPFYTQFREFAERGGAVATGRTGEPAIHGWLDLLRHRVRHYYRAVRSSGWASVWEWGEIPFDRIGAPSPEQVALDDSLEHLVLQARGPYTIDPIDTLILPVAEYTIVRGYRHYPGSPSERQRRCSVASSGGSHMTTTARSTIFVKRPSNCARCCCWRAKPSQPRTAARRGLLVRRKAQLAS
jgi:hypothetical protein